MIQRRPYYNMTMESILHTSEMRQLQRERLKHAIRFSYDHVPFDRERMDAASVRPEDIDTPEDFAKALKPCSQADYREIFERYDFDIDKVLLHLCGQKRLDDLYLITSTSGTTGIPTPYPCFHRSTEAMKEVFGRIGWRAGLGEGSRLAVCFGLSMHAAGVPHLFWYKGIEGLNLLPIGAEVGTERMLKLMKMFKVNSFTGTPSLALHLVERASEILGSSIKDLGIKTLICGAEPGAGISEIRSRLENSYGAKVLDIGAGYGVSCDHPVYQGMHWVADDLCLYELVDPDTFEQIPLVDGATGLACFTTLIPEEQIFFNNLRFTTNDIHQVFTEPCPCGQSGFRYKIVGRTDDMLKVKGVPVYPAAIQGVINGFVPKVSGAFRIVLTEKPPLVMPPLKLKVEYGEGVNEAELPALEIEICKKMQSVCKFRPSITWLHPNTLERSLKKTNLLEKVFE
jgi:phenylacetate-CoA ligase